MINYTFSSDVIRAAYLAYCASNPGCAVSARSFVAGYNAALAASNLGGDNHETQIAGSTAETDSTTRGVEASQAGAPAGTPEEVQGAKPIEPVGVQARDLAPSAFYTGHPNRVVRETSRAAVEANCGAYYLHEVQGDTTFWTEAPVPPGESPTRYKLFRVIYRGTWEEG
jgi:hypothetical protein